MKNLLKSFALCVVLISFYGGVFGQATNQLNSTGNAGVGTTSPASILHIKTSASPILKIESGSSTDLGRIIMSDGSDSGYLDYIHNTDTWSLKTLGVERFTIANGTIQAISGGSTVFRIKSGLTTDLSRIIMSDGTDAGYLDYEHGSDSWSFKTSGTEKMRINSSGNVGINTTSPSVKLHVKHTGDELFRLETSTDSANYVGRLKFYNVTTQAGNIQSGKDGSNNAFLALGSADSQHLYIDSNGLISIGNSAPGFYNSAANNLVVGSGSGDEGLSIITGSANTGTIAFGYSSGSSATKGQINYAHASDTMGFYTDNSLAITIDSNQKIGIGNSNPGSYDGSTNNLVVGDTTGHKGITVISGSTSTASVAFGDGTGVNAYKGQLAYYHGSDALAFISNGLETMRIDSSNKLGVNNTTPSSYHSAANNLVVGNTGDEGISIISGTANSGSLTFGDGTGAAAYKGQIIYEHNNDALAINVNGSEAMRIDSGGNVIIGDTTAETDYILSVKGKAVFGEIKLDADWADYVFEDDYKLMSLEDVEKSINENGHLPGVPSGKDVETNGLMASSMLSTHMAKIEELTLYSIQQNKKLKSQDKMIKALMTRLDKLENIEVK
ncbi:MAG: hypothetical protein COA79_23045 [Planctomycetota bacterium]|nr:MAG: hypothetical protein COA79_23045 [Planctomycetota bacterium]